MKSTTWTATFPQATIIITSQWLWYLHDDYISWHIAPLCWGATTIKDLRQISGANELQKTIWRNRWVGRWLGIEWMTSRENADMFPAVVVFSYLEEREKIGKENSKRRFRFSTLCITLTNFFCIFSIMMLSLSRFERSRWHCARGIAWQ